MDNSLNSSNHSPNNQPCWCCCRYLRCHQQWLPILGASIRKALFRLLGDSSSLPFPQGSYGEAEQDADHCRHLVNSLGLNLLLALGSNRSICDEDKRTCHHKMWNQLLKWISFCFDSSLGTACTFFACKYAVCHVWTKYIYIYMGDARERNKARVNFFFFLGVAYILYFTKFCNWI